MISHSADSIQAELNQLQARAQRTDTAQLLQTRLEWHSPLAGGSRESAVEFQCSDRGQT